MFFSFDGLDGTGKSTQLRLFVDWLRAQDHDVVTCVEPGSTPLGEDIREILLGNKHLGMSRRAEMLLFMAARAQLVEQIIQPAINAGKTVVSDRYLLANVVYQGHAGGLDVESIWHIGNEATTGIEPDLTFVLDMPPAAATGRIGRELDRMETYGDEFRVKVRAGFLTEAAHNPRQIKVIDAARSIEAVHADIIAHAQSLLGSVRQ